MRSCIFRIRLSVPFKTKENIKLFDFERAEEKNSGKVTDISNHEFEQLLGRPIPETKWDTGRPLERNDAISQLFYAKSGLARLIYKILTGIKKRSEAKGKPDLNILFIYNMPFGGIAKMAAGAINLDMVDGILKIVNGHFFKGLGHAPSPYIRGAGF